MKRCPPDFDSTDRPQPPADVPAEPGWPTDVPIGGPPPPPPPDAWSVPPLPPGDRYDGVIVDARRPHPARGFAVILTILLVCAGGLGLVALKQQTPPVEPYYPQEESETTMACDLPAANAALDAVIAAVDGTEAYRDNLDATSCEGEVAADGSEAGVTATLVTDLKGRGYTVKTRAPDEFVDHTEVSATGKGGEHLVLDVACDDSDQLTWVGVTVTEP